jgi:hypothetical protein
LSRKCTKKTQRFSLTTTSFFFHISGCSGTSERAVEYVLESREFNTCKVALLCQENLQNLLNGLSEVENPQGVGVTQSSSNEMRIQRKVFPKCNQQDATFVNLFISIKCSTCFRRFLRPSSGAQIVHTASGIVKPFCCPLLSWLGWNGFHPNHDSSS